MTYLAPHFDPDVFVSYSHGDPRADNCSPLKDWTQTLIRRLESEVDGYSAGQLGDMYSKGVGVAQD